jgi:predicted nucleic acid-binding protein
MGITHLWDTNTVIYYLQQQFPPHAEVFIDQLITQSNPAVSAITEIELLSWKTYSIKLADAVIAATALVFDLTLVTRNTEDFTRIDKLKLINPWNQ